GAAARAGPIPGVRSQRAADQVASSLGLRRASDRAIRKPLRPALPDPTSKAISSVTERAAGPLALSFSRGLRGGRPSSARDRELLGKCVMLTLGRRRVDGEGARRGKIVLPAPLMRAWPRVQGRSGRRAPEGFTSAAGLGDNARSTAVEPPCRQTTLVLEPFACPVPYAWQPSRSVCSPCSPSSPGPPSKRSSS